MDCAKPINWGIGGKPNVAVSDGHTNSGVLTQQRQLGRHGLNRAS